MMHLRPPFCKSVLISFCNAGMTTGDRCEMPPIPLRSTPIKGFILDITGVLYNSMEGTDGIPIQGSAHAVNRYGNDAVVFSVHDNNIF